MSESEMERAISMVKSYWPEYKITKDMLKRPNYDFVFKFYTDCVNDLDQKVSFLNDSDCAADNIDLPAEEKIFLRLSKLPLPVKVTLGDIYKPTSIRTTKFFEILIHMLIYTDSIISDTLEIIKDLRNVQEDVENIESENDKILEEISENSQKLGHLKKEQETLLTEQKGIIGRYREVTELKVAADKIKFDKRKEIEEIKNQNESEKQELEHLEDIEKGLLEQVVPEDNFRQLQSTFNSLTEEEEELKSFDTDVGDGLEEQNNIIQHMQDCIRALKGLKTNEGVKIFQEVEELLKNEEQGMKIILTQLTEAKTIEINLKTEENKLKNDLVTLEKDTEESKKDLCKMLEEMQIIINNIADNYKKGSVTQNKTICSLEESILKLQSELDKLKKACREKSQHSQKLQNEIITNFYKKFLITVKEKSTQLKC